MGSTGAQGSQGNTGHAGAQGAIGTAGPTGSTGAQGAQGSQGGVGSTGAQGPSGVIGHAGAQGATGTKGPTGSTAAAGGQGSQGAASNLGPQGPKGATGGVGPTGNTGAQGSQGGGGATGAQGTTGPAGSTGAPGSSGPGGASGGGGATGAQGAQGAQGATGPPGVECYYFNSYFYPSCIDACNYTNGSTYYYYQQTTYNSLYANKYVSNGNCAISTCDWNQTAYYNSSSSCVPLNYTCGSATGFGFSCGFSDVRLKNGIETLKNVLESIMKIDAVEYDWNKNLNPSLFDYFKKQQKLHTIGLIAQNVRLYFPEVVRMNDDGYYSIDYSKLNAVLVEGIKEQQIFIEDIDKQLEYIKSKIK